MSKKIWKAIHLLLKEMGYKVVSSSIYGNGDESIRFRKKKSSDKEDEK